MRVEKRLTKVETELKEVCNEMSDLKGGMGGVEIRMSSLEQRFEDFAGYISRQLDTHFRSMSVIAGVLTTLLVAILGVAI